MAQKMWLGSIGGTGIIAVLFIIGLVLYFSNANKNLGNFSMTVAVIFAVIFGLFGIAGILKRFLK